MKSYIEYFREICSIPHGSGNTEKLCDYCEAFAAEHGLKYIREKSGNIIIFKDATAGFENSEPVILQGHLDMVCVSEEKNDIDFETDGLTVCEDESSLFASGTSLGGDDGIAIAYALEILERDDIAHPPLEVVFTVDEETGMDGAGALDVSVLRAKRLINLDSEEEGVLLTSCAGGVRADVTFDAVFDEAFGETLRVSLSSFAGGHSGTEINLGRQNAGILLCSMLKSAGVKRVGALTAGVADNAIPTTASAVIEKTPGIEETLKEIFEQFRRAFRREDRDAVLLIEPSNGKKLVSQGDTSQILSYITRVYNGVITKSEMVGGLVQTSLNLGVIRTNESGVVISHALRSSVNSEREALENDVRQLATLLGGSIVFHSAYPAWEYRESSVLRRTFSQVYERLFKTPMLVTAIHAGLECGILSGKIENLDCVSVGPDIHGAHTTKERLDKKSAKRVFSLLLAVLEELK